MITTLRGTIFPLSLNEIFSHSLAVQSGKSLTQTATDVKAAWETAWTDLNWGLKVITHPSVAYTEATAATILNPSSGELSAAAHVTWTPPLIGGGGTTNNLPSQVAVVVSLLGGTHMNGTPLKGRFYLPVPHVNVCAADGTIDVNILERFATTAKSFLDALTSNGIWPSIWSRKDAGLQRVTEIRVGRKLDTQRRRRNSLPELYSSRTLAAPG